jgi:hypothetical protein
MVVLVQSSTSTGKMVKFLTSSWIPETGHAVPLLDPPQLLFQTLQRPPPKGLAPTLPYVAAAAARGRKSSSPAAHDGLFRFLPSGSVELAGRVEQVES